MAHILSSVHKGVATITLNRPHHGNALTIQMNQTILGLLPVFANDPAVRVLVITGAGPYFCTGMDLGAALKGNQESFQEFDIFHALYTFPKPVIARINGPCLGGGVGLVFVADIRIAIDQAYFALTEVKRGLVPAIISQYLVPELGSLSAREYMLTGRRISTAEARFLSAVVPLDDLDSKVQSYCTMLISSAPQASATIKQLIRTVTTSTDNDKLRVHLGTIYANMIKSDEAQYGIQAFINKRIPDWTLYSANKAKL
ncbi:enoyl-CoA hydratase [Phycomyces nitens]|nr:enoyl-CoA hydratase [Phycomyces nitens]